MDAATRIGVLGCLMALAFVINPGLAHAQNERDCAWPIELSPEGFSNITGPDDLARYWVMPFDRYDQLTIKGTYPNARYFSFTAYDTNYLNMPAGVAGSLHDAQIAPDSGANPFVTPGTDSGTYTVVIARDGQTSGNTINVSTDFGWVLLRVYVPDPDLALTGNTLSGGVPLPTIAATENGETRELQPCSPVNKLGDLRAFLADFFPPGLDIIGGEGTPSTDRLWFGAPTAPPPVLMPNPDNKYIITFPGDQYQPGRIIVIHGKAPSAPGTSGNPQARAAPPDLRTADVRYWSVCVTNLALPVSAVGCTADPTASLQGGDYTIVISNDLQRPDWLRPNVNWIPWGDEGYPKVVFFRNMLPATNFPYAIQDAIAAGCTFDFDFPTLPARGVVDTAAKCAQGVMGDYYPVAAWCDRSTFVHGGWRACIKEQ